MEGIMKYGIITYDKRPMELDAKDVKNIGDIIQTYAARKLIRNIAREDDVVEISYYDLPYYAGDEYVVLLCNGYNSFLPQVHSKTRPDFPYAEKIIPVFISFHCHTAIPANAVEYLKKYEPIGCRDEESMKNLRKHNIEAYCSGCITSLLDKRDKSIKGDTVYFIDTPAELDKYIPKEKSDKVVKMSQIYKLPRTNGKNIMTENEYREIEKYTLERINMLRNKAALVVTSRLHIASPCMAMGIPVICAGINFDRRFSWIDKYIRLYTPESFEKIDWNVEAIDYEKEKAFIKASVLKHIKKIYADKRSIYELSEFYESRERFDYNFAFIRQLEKLPFDEKTSVKYGIWGIVSASVELKSVIDKYYPRWKLCHAIDMKCEGKFEGYNIEKPDVAYNAGNDIVWFVVPPSALNAVGKELRRLNKPYILISHNKCFYDLDIYLNN